MNVFIVEDSPTISLILERTLSSYGYLPFCYTSDTLSLRPLNDHSHDFFILDTNLSSHDSLALCKRVRKLQPSSYIIGITHKGTWEDRINFLNGGADDCISYPFPPEEVLARMQALLRRPRVSLGSNLTFGKFRLDPHKRQAFYDRKKLDVSGKEYSLLEYFIRNGGRSITRSELMDHVWDYRKPVASNTVDVHITKLRKKINSPKDSVYKNPNNFGSEIQTVYGVGYKMNNNFEKKRESSLSSSA
ncbi:MAG: response regulator transcription factor [bacterium]